MLLFLESWMLWYSILVGLSSAKLDDRPNNGDLPEVEEEEEGDDEHEEGFIIDREEEDVGVE